MIGRELGVYKILEKRGEGGMGVVYKALDQSLDRIVGIKTLHQELVSDEQSRRRLEREAKSLARLNHEHIVTIYQYLESDGMHYIVMEYIEGQTLGDIIKKSAPLNFRDTSKIVMQVLQAIGYAHQHDVIHRDIKPDNILLNRRGSVKVSDFGIAKLMDPKYQTRTGTTPGSPFYMAPEQFESGSVDFRTDIYGLGVTMYQMITGRLPFKAESEYLLLKKIAEEPPPPPSQFNSALTQVQDDLVLRAIQKRPADRFQSVFALTFALLAESKVRSMTDSDPLAGFSATAEQGSLTARTTRSPRQGSREKRKKIPGWWIFLSILLLVVIVVWFVFWAR